MRLFLGDCKDVLKSLPPDSVDSVVTDPPYGLSFMGKSWDYNVPSVETWKEVFRALKPGGYLLSFFGTRTYHRGVIAIEDAGFEIRDQIAWVYGSGFPKSLNVSKAIDAHLGLERTTVVAKSNRHNSRPFGADSNDPDYGSYAGGVPDVFAPASDEAAQWDGFGTALKPAMEPIVVARKPLSEKTVAANVMAHGTGGLNIDACRVGAEGGGTRRCSSRDSSGKCMGHKNTESPFGETFHGDEAVGNLGRWPANFIHDGSDEVLELFPATGKSSGGGMKDLSKSNLFQGDTSPNLTTHCGFGDSGSAARFFYCAKASKKDRGEGNNHPTVKPQALMRYLCRLVTPPQGVVLDPFMGSGTTGVAAVEEGFDFIGIEKDPASYAITMTRLGIVV